jgi:hypothetical protein
MSYSYQNKTRTYTYRATVNFSYSAQNYLTKSCVRFASHLFKILSYLWCSSPPWTSTTCFGYKSHLQAEHIFTVGLIVWLICDEVRDLTVSMHLGLNWRALCAPYRFMGALLLHWSSRWPPDLYSWCRLTPRMSPDTHVWVKPKLNTHKECGLRFHPLLHTA